MANFCQNPIAVNCFLFFLLSVFGVVVKRIFVRCSMRWFFQLRDEQETCVGYG